MPVSSQLYADSHVSVVRRNIIANAAAKGWAVLLSLGVIPIYIHFIGIEAWGLMGFFLSLMSVLSLLDLGLGTALNLRFAQYSVQPDRAQEMHDLLRTLEVIYWLVGVAIAATLVALAPAIAAYWIKPQTMAPEIVTQALAMMGIAVAFQWPRVLYSGGLMGMQRQVAANVLMSITGTASSLGGALVLWLVSPTIQALIAWLMAISLVDTLVGRLMLRRFLPTPPRRTRFNRRLLAEIWRFVAGMTGISVMSVILTQLDKMILAKLLPLDAFGYYSLASRVAGGLYFLTGPVATAFFPRFTQLLLTGDREELARLYHRGCQLVSATVLPVAIVLVLFAADFLLLWTRDAAIAGNTGATLALLAAGTAINCLMYLPFTLQLASGRTRLVLYIHTTSVIVMAPLIFVLALHYGGLGAAWVWLVLNCGYLAFALPLMHRRLLPGHLRRWFVTDVGAPLAAALLVAGLWALVAGQQDNPARMLLNLAGVSLLSLLAAAFATPQIRGLIVHHSRRGVQPKVAP